LHVVPLIDLLCTSPILYSPLRSSSANHAVHQGEPHVSDKVSQIDCRPRLDVCSFHLPMCSNISSMYSISAPILLIFFLDRWRCVSFFWHTLVSPFPSLVCRVHAVRCSHVYLCLRRPLLHPPATQGNCRRVGGAGRRHAAVPAHVWLAAATPTQRQPGQPGRLRGLEGVMGSP